MLGKPNLRWYSGTMSTFTSDVVNAVITHMNDDHGEDSLIIVQANGAPGATESRMADLDDEGGVWDVTDEHGTRQVRVDWPSGPIAERAQIRREIVLLYRAACETLGIAPREAAKPFSQVIREGSWTDHEDSEGADFMASIMRGHATLDDYIALVVQHFYMYEALESVVAEVVDDPVFAPFHSDALARMDALEADLTDLIGSHWREVIEPAPATSSYATRIREVGRDGWIPAVVAHHYTRYLGDLSGGQIIAKRMVRQHGFEHGAGTKFYDFTTLGSIDEFKARYRAALDELGERLTPEERQRMLDEVRLAYRFNTDVFVDMARARSPLTVSA